MKSNENKKSLQPRLRFREFRDDEGWEEKELNELGSLVSGLTYSPDDVKESGLLVLRSSNIQNGAISLEDKVYVIPDVKGVNLSQPNDILICVRNGSKSLIGKNALIPEGLPICTHGAFMTVFRSKSWKFVFQLFQTKAYQKQVDGDLGATINSINGRHLMKYKFVVPSPEEQQKIADCLSSLDELIEAEDQKLEALQRHKKGLMQELFPAEGQTLPKRRFPEFQSAPEWEETLLGNHCTITTGKLDANAMVENGQYRFYTCAKDHYLIDKYAFDTDALLVSGNGANVGYIHYYKGKFNAYQRTYVLDQLTQDIFFIKYYLEKNLHKRIATEKKEGNTPYIVMSTLTDMIIILPKNKKEQQKIADCLSSIDDSITTQTKKLESLRLHKKGLMQQLFPNHDQEEITNQNKP